MCSCHWQCITSILNLTTTLCAENCQLQEKEKVVAPPKERAKEVALERVKEVAPEKEKVSRTWSWSQASDDRARPTLFSHFIITLTSSQDLHRTKAKEEE